MTKKARVGLLAPFQVPLGHATIDSCAAAPPFGDESDHVRAVHHMKQKPYYHCRAAVRTSKQQLRTQLHDMQLQNLQDRLTTRVPTIVA